MRVSISGVSASSDATQAKGAVAEVTSVRGASGARRPAAAHAAAGAPGGAGGAARPGWIPPARPAGRPRGPRLSPVQPVQGVRRRPSADQLWPPGCNDASMRVDHGRDERRVEIDELLFRQVMRSKAGFYPAAGPDRGRGCAGGSAPGCAGDRRRRSRRRPPDGSNDNVQVRARAARTARAGWLSAVCSRWPGGGVGDISFQHVRRAPPPGRTPARPAGPACRPLPRSRNRHTRRGWSLSSPHGPAGEGLCHGGSRPVGLRSRTKNVSLVRHLVDQPGDQINGRSWPDPTWPARGCSNT